MSCGWARSGDPGARSGCSGSAVVKSRGSLLDHARRAVPLLVQLSYGAWLLWGMGLQGSRRVKAWVPACLRFGSQYFNGRHRSLLVLPASLDLTYQETAGREQGQARGGLAPGTSSPHG